MNYLVVMRKVAYFGAPSVCAYDLNTGPTQSYDNYQNDATSSYVRLPKRLSLLG